MSMEQQWKDTDRRTSLIAENPSQCYFIKQNLAWTGLGLNTQHSQL